MPRTPSWAKNYKRPKAEAVEPEVAELARQIAGAYRLFLNHYHPFSNPWHATKPVEETQFWASFVKAARIVQELNATPKDFIQAQWEGIMKMARCKADRVLFPQMLTTDNARLRYASFAGKQQARSMRVAKPTQLVNADPHMRDTRRLAKLVAAYGKSVSEEDILVLHFIEFSRGFLKARGVWSQVAADYERLLAG